MAAASCSLSPTYIDRVSLHFFPFVSHATLKTPFRHTTSLNFSPFSSLSRSLTICAAFDGVEISQEEDPVRILRETVLHGNQVENAMEENEASESVEAGRLYVGNLPFTVTPAELSEIFAEAGRVVSVEVCVLIFGIFNWISFDILWLIVFLLISHHVCYQEPKFWKECMQIC